MNRIFSLTIKVLIIFSLISFYSFKVYAEEIETILKQLQEDIKTLEKAVYSSKVKTTSSIGNLSSENSDILTNHLLKLSDLEEQFKILTNNFEEINFKLDKLSNRITKVQTDNQMRFQDLERSDLSGSDKTTLYESKKLHYLKRIKDIIRLNGLAMPTEKQLLERIDVAEGSWRSIISNVLYLCNKSNSTS